MYGKIITTLKHHERKSMSQEASPYPCPTGVVPRHSVGSIQFGPITPQIDNAYIIDGIVASIKTKDKKHSHYFKDVSHLDTIDVYRVLDLFQVTDPAIAHAAKKLLVAGGRGAGKDINKDIAEAIDTLIRWQAMRAEDNV